jgi:hypothetical protein
LKLYSSFSVPAVSILNTLPAPERRVGATVRGRAVERAVYFCQRRLRVYAIGTVTEAMQHLFRSARPDAEDSTISRARSRTGVAAPVRAALICRAVQHAVHFRQSRRAGPITDDIAETSEFPIFGDEDRGGATGVGSQRFNQVSKSGVPTYGSGLFKIRGMDLAAQAIIEGLQPYHRGSSFREHPLWILHELDRINKHRLLHFVVAAFDGVGINTRTSRNVQINPGLFESNGGAIGTDTIVARIPLGPIDPTKEMLAEVKPAFFIALTQIPGGVQNISALSVLENIFNYVYGSVLPPLTPFMP